MSAAMSVSAVAALRPMAVSGYDHNGTRKLMPISDREIGRSETFLRRVLRADPSMRGRYAMIISTFRDMPHMTPFERVVISRGIVCCGAEANPWDGARVESTIRRFDVALVAAVTPVVMQAIRTAGHDPAALFAGKIVWASGAAYDELAAAGGMTLRRWATLGPALAIEGMHGGGAHVDGREWRIEPEGDITYVSSRLDRAQSFERLPVEMRVRIVPDPCPSGAYGPRLEF